MYLVPRTSDFMKLFLYLNSYECQQNKTNDSITLDAGSMDLHQDIQLNKEANQTYKGKQMNYT